MASHGTRARREGRAVRCDTTNGTLARTPSGTWRSCAPLAASRPELVRSVMHGLAEGLAAHSARQAELGLDDLTDDSAAATMAAFLTSGTGAPA
ncbi:hypothetical protein ACFY9H_31445 [Streptomyces bacillaris]|uniref:hypothetical protein n=1 Tax=Streptomyces bacillaris TaxID=68179 RepID=UPI0036E98D86